MPWLLGAELGGSKLQVGLRPAGVAEQVPAQVWRCDVVAEHGAGAIREALARGVDEVLATHGLGPGDVRAMGIGFGGPVDSDSGVVVRSHQVSGWESFPLASWASDRFGFPVVVHNDADTAALAEASVGAGAGLSPVLFVTVGSGVGAGLVRDGEIERGSGGGALELGQMRMAGYRGRVPEPPAADGWGPTVEQVASGFGIGERARRIGAGVTARDVSAAAQRGDRQALDLLADAADALGWALGQAVTLLNPAVVVVGGGVSLTPHELFLHRVRATCRATAFPPFADVADIVPAALGEHVVVVGALELAARGG